MSRPITCVLVTGAHGFIGQNLVLALEGILGFSVLRFGRQDDLESLPGLLEQCDAVVHLAGENRPQTESDFETVNVGLTRALCDALSAITDRNIPVLFSSSTHAERDTPYGISKRAGEDVLRRMANQTEHGVLIYRLPGVFGKWCKPNYNSVVATFCHNIAHGLPISVHSPRAHLDIVYVDDVITQIVDDLRFFKSGAREGSVTPVYTTTLGDLATSIQSFHKSRHNLTLGDVGVGLQRALYATYISYLPIAETSYDLQQHGDERGVFVEMLKTQNSGQFSYFTAGPGVTRGGHYHHTKTEKFLLLKGKAIFRFRHMKTGETYELTTQGGTPQVVDTLPGWAHDITNIGDEDIIVMLWANEIFDHDRPDTFEARVT